MRNTIVLLLLLLCFKARSQSGARSVISDTNYHFRTICGPTKSAEDMMCVIDGVLADAVALKNLNPALIDSIFILKESLKNSFPCRPPRPVIVIYTKRNSQAGFTIRDKDDQAPLPGATVSFISTDRSDTLMYVADSAGLVSRRDLKKGKLYDILVTATGYKSFAGSVSAIRSSTIELERDLITGPEVIISSGIVCRCSRRCVGHFQQISQGCGVQTMMIIDQRSEVVTERVRNCNMSVFPNPVQRGQQLTLKWLTGYFPSGSIRVLTMDGKQVLTVPVNEGQKQGLIQVPVSQGWAPGVYIFQLVYANGRPGASEKVILQ